MTRPPRLDDGAVAAWLGEHRRWHLEGGHLVAEVVTRDYPSSVRILDAQVELAERLAHHPIVTLGWRRLRFELWTHDRGGLTRLDLDYGEGLDAVLQEFAPFVVS